VAVGVEMAFVMHGMVVAVVLVDLELERRFL
jgi:hypothetical protein